MAFGSEKVRELYGGEAGGNVGASRLSAMCADGSAQDGHNTATSGGALRATVHKSRGHPECRPHGQVTANQAEKPG